MEVRLEGASGPMVTNVDEVLRQLQQQLKDQQKQWVTQLRDHPAKFADLEACIHQVFDGLADQVVAGVLAQATAADDFAAERNPGLTLDVEHLWKFTLGDASLEILLDSLRVFLTHYGHKLRHVHLPGYWPGFPEHRPMYCARDMIFPVFSLLAEAGYEGFVVSEVELEYQNVHELRMDVLLHEAWREKHERDSGS